MILAGIKVTNTALVRDAIDLARSSSEPYLFNHVMRSWLFGILLSEDVKPSPDPELLAVSTVLHDLGLTEHYMARSGSRSTAPMQRARYEGARYLNAAAATCLGCDRPSYNPLHRSPQRARSRNDPFRYCGGRYRGWSRSNSDG